jgi:hypothetical protein
MIHVTFMYKVHQTNSASDLRLAYSHSTNPDLGGNSRDFTYPAIGNIGLPGQNDVWYTGTLTIAKNSGTSANITDASAFSTGVFWFRFESTLSTRAGGIVEQVWVDNVQIWVDR